MKEQDPYLIICPSASALNYWGLPQIFGIEKKYQYDASRLAEVHQFSKGGFPNVVHLLCRCFKEFWSVKAVSYTHLDVYKRQA